MQKVTFLLVITFGSVYSVYVITACRIRLLSTKSNRQQGKPFKHQNSNKLTRGKKWLNKVQRKRITLTN